ncbi:MAG: YkgJ family cysteine cluster protein [Syntrophothermus sp.]
MIKQTFVDFINSVQNFNSVDMHNPKCINCNNCCSMIVNISKYEIENIVRFLRKNREIVKQINNNGKSIIGFDGVIDASCPFSIDKKCIINSVKPEICEKYHCNKELCKTFNRDEIFDDKYYMLKDLFDNNRKLKNDILNKKNFIF